MSLKAKTCPAQPRITPSRQGVSKVENTILLRLPTTTPWCLLVHHRRRAEHLLNIFNPPKFHCFIMSSAPGPVMELLGRLVDELTIMRPMMPTYLHLLV